MMIEKLTKATEEALGDINVLLRQLSERVPLCTSELLKSIVENDSLELWVAKDGERIVGMGELAIVRKPEGIIAQAEDIVVDEKQRGQGIGKMLSEKLIERARAQGARVIQLSSRPSRLAANELYQKLGFKSHETNSYYLNL
ncbi:GNAT family N-acetyltransferase [Candidatus Kaiserbacteria bacterium]|nr:GNAT family N-acetyltransferase [Candidatus Kaiserbacteria bacterium]